MNNIINMLNSTNNIPNQSGSDSKVKMMAHQYKRFLSKNKNNQSSKYAKCFFTTIRKISQGSTKIWNLLSIHFIYIVPITVRGPTTPF